MEYRHGALRTREPATRRLPEQDLLRNLAAGLETLLAERGLVSAEEIVAGHALGEPKSVDSYGRAT